MHIHTQYLNIVHVMLQVKLQHLVTLHVRSSAFGSKLDAGMFMKALSVQYDVWAENHYQRMLSVGLLLRCCFMRCLLLCLLCTAELLLHALSFAAACTAELLLHAGICCCMHCDLLLHAL